MMSNLIALYIDPGTGSLFFQILIGGILASLVFVKNFWYKIVGVFRKGNKDEDLD